MIDVSVVYRRGPLTSADYEEAIQKLQDAMTQLTPDSQNCSVCHDSDHIAQECHHNPLVMARRVVQSQDCWRCYHCGEVFFDHSSAEEHFGPIANANPICAA